MSDKNDEITELLKRDAERVDGDAVFDAKLHQDTMRRIRQEADAPGGSKAAPAGWRWFFAAPSLVGAAALVILLSVVLWPESSTGPEGGGSIAGTGEMEKPIELVPVEPARASAFGYTKALSGEENDLLAMLDSDARVLLPKSASVFAVNR